MQVAVMDKDGKVHENRRIECNPVAIKKAFSKMPKNAKYVLESSSVWYGIYRMLTDKLKLDVTLSNPYKTRLIAESKKKTDKVDAQILADLLRGDYVAACHVPDENTVKKQQLVRYRHKMVQESIRFKNMIHGILLQEGIDIPGTPFCAP